MNNFQEELYRQKYLKYKEKYIAAKQFAGNPIVESELRPGKGQEIGLVTSVEHPYYNVTNNNGTYRLVLRAGIPHKLKRDGKKKEYPIEKNDTFVLFHPEVCDFRQGKCGDIVKIYSRKEKKYLLDNEATLLSKGFITESLYKGSQDYQSSHDAHAAHAVQFVETAPIVKSSHAHNLELPSDDETDDDEETMAIVRAHQARDHDFEHQSHDHQRAMPTIKSSKRSSGRPAPMIVDLWRKEANAYNPYAPESHQMSSHSVHSVHSGEGTLISRSSDGGWTARVNLNGQMQEVMIPQRVIQSDFGRSIRPYERKAVRVSCILENGKYIVTSVRSISGS
jgi:hypothetical protein